MVKVVFSIAITMASHAEEVALANLLGRLRFRLPCQPVIMTVSVDGPGKW
jgi:hypothetical protein